MQGRLIEAEVEGEAVKATSTVLCKNDLTLVWQDDTAATTGVEIECEVVRADDTDSLDSERLRHREIARGKRLKRGQHSRGFLKWLETMSF